MFSKQQLEWWHPFYNIRCPCFKGGTTKIPLSSHFTLSITYFHLKILALAGIWIRDLPGSKPICYQLSYPGLDHLCSSVFAKSWILWLFINIIKLDNRILYQKCNKLRKENGAEGAWKWTNHNWRKSGKSKYRIIRRRYSLNEK